MKKIISFLLAIITVSFFSIPLFVMSALSFNLPSFTLTVPDYVFAGEEYELKLTLNKNGVTDLTGIFVSLSYDGKLIEFKKKNGIMGEYSLEKASKSDDDFVLVNDNDVEIDILDYYNSRLEDGETVTLYFTVNKNAKADECISFKTEYARCTLGSSYFSFRDCDCENAETLVFDTPVTEFKGNGLQLETSVCEKVKGGVFSVKLVSVPENTTFISFGVRFNGKRIAFVYDEETHETVFHSDFSSDHIVRYGKSHLEASFMDFDFANVFTAGDTVSFDFTYEGDRPDGETAVFELYNVKYSVGSEMLETFAGYHTDTVYDFANTEIFIKTSDTECAYGGNTNMSLTEAVVPAYSYDGLKVTSIADGAFENRADLTAITVNADIVSIGCNAFRGCTSLSEFTIPANVKSIGDGAFANTECRITVATENKYFVCVDNALSDTNGALYRTLGYIPDNTVILKNYAFSGCAENTVTIPLSVTMIEEKAFSESSVSDIRYAGFASEWEKVTVNDNSINVTISVRGDADGDGKITTLDYIAIRLAILKIAEIPEERFRSADVDQSGKLDIVDYISVRVHLLNFVLIEQ